MRLRRFTPCGSSTVGWQPIASDEHYLVEKCTLDLPRPGPPVVVWPDHSCAAAETILNLFLANLTLFVNLF